MAKKQKLKQAEYIKFLSWLCLCKSERPLDEKTETAWSDKYKVSRMTLWEWARTPEFVNDLEHMNKGILPIRLQNVRNSIYTNATEKEDTAAAKLYLQYEAGFEEKSKIEIENNLEDIIRELNKEKDGKE